MPFDAARERERQRRIRQTSPKQRTPQPQATELRMGGGNVSLAVVCSLSEDLDVLFVKYVDENGDPDPEAEAQSVMVWPKMTNKDWVTFVGTNIVVPVVKYLGVAYAMQLPRWYMREDPGGMPGGDCPL